MKYARKDIILPPLRRAWLSFLSSSSLKKIWEPVTFVSWVRHPVLAEFHPCNLGKVVVVISAFTTRPSALRTCLEDPSESIQWPFVTDLKGSVQWHVGDTVGLVR